jgi:ankyrin repeat protein
MNVDATIGEFLNAACSDNLQRARDLLAAAPALAVADVAVAAVLGRDDVVEGMLDHDPALVTMKRGPDNAEPLLYLSFSRFSGAGEEHASGILRTARLLLSRGADPNAFYIDPEFPDARLPALYGATGATDNPSLAALLLEAGANPNDGESIYHAAQHNHRECLALLLKHGADISSRSPAFNNTPLYFLFGYMEGDAGAEAATEGARWLLEHGADPNVTSYESGETPLHAAARNGRSAPVIAMLLDHGADPNARRSDGRTPYALAARRGHTHVMEVLRNRGAAVEQGPVDTFIAACARGDADEVRAILSTYPALVGSLEGEDRQIMADLAADGNLAAVRVMLDAGFDPDTPGAWDGPPLHQAAWRGYAGVVDLLLARGASLELRNCYGGDALGTALHGALNCRNPKGDYPAVIRSLVAAGSPVDDQLRAMGGEMLAAALGSMKSG